MVLNSKATLINFQYVAKNSQIYIFNRIQVYFDGLSETMDKSMFFLIFTLKSVVNFLIN